jgi:nucleoside recognition membrane protein YjiH
VIVSTSKSTEAEQKATYRAVPELVTVIPVSALLVSFLPLESPSAGPVKDPDVKPVLRASI